MERHPRNTVSNRLTLSMQHLQRLETKYTLARSAYDSSVSLPSGSPPAAITFLVKDALARKNDLDRTWRDAKDRWGQIDPTLLLERRWGEYDSLTERLACHEKVIPTLIKSVEDSAPPYAGLAQLIPARQGEITHSVFQLSLEVANFQEIGVDLYLERLRSSQADQATVDTNDMRIARQCIEQADDSLITAEALCDKIQTQLEEYEQLNWGLPSVDRGLPSLLQEIDLYRISREELAHLIWSIDNAGDVGS